MNYPSPGSMQLLFAIYDGHAMEIKEDELWLCVPPDAARVFEAHFDIPATEDAVPTFVVPERCTDALFERGWIEWCDTDGKPKITDPGRYHLERWVRGYLLEIEKRESRRRWLKRASLAEIRLHYRIKTPEEWERTKQAVTTEDE